MHKTPAPNVLICPDKFKGTLTATEVCRCIQRGLERSGLEASIQEFPLADGGDGTLEIFLWHLHGKTIECTVHDPLMRTVKSHYGLSQDNKVAYIEMARASGLNLLNPSEYNALKTTTLGTGELMLHAMRHGAEKIILGIGGSATNDAGLGAASALGYRFLDRKGNMIVPTGENLIHIETIDKTHLNPLLEAVSVTAMCDVTNPFHGPAGAAFTYAAQKGASPDDIIKLDEGLQHIALLFQKSFGVDIQLLPGAGAGGGMGGGMHMLFTAPLMPATEIIFDLINLSKAISQADIIVTGEGKSDEQTMYGKLIAQVGHLAHSMNKKVIVVCGQNQLSQEQAHSLGIDAILSMSEYAGSKRSIEQSATVLENLALEKLSDIIRTI